MDAVLGLSVTPSAVGLVLVEGQDVDGATMDGEGFEVRSRGWSSALQTSEQAAAAVLRTEAIAADRGHRVHSIGVTWSDDADTEASLLLKSLSDCGFDNIVRVRLSEATDALARGIAEVTGYSTTAVCVIEPEQLIALVVQTDQGAVQTAVNHSVVTEEDLIGWLSAVFTRADWEPEALVLVGSAEDLDGLQPVLEEALSVPVFTPAKAQLALARGAALACARNGEFGFDGDIGDAAGSAAADTAGPPAARRGVRRLPQSGPRAMLAAGIVTFVVSASAALALQAAPERVAPRPAADTSVQTPVAVRSPAPAAPPPPAPVLEAAPLPPPEADPVPEALPIAGEAPFADAALPQPEVPAAPPPLDAPQAPGGAVPPALPAPEMVPPPVPEERPGILDRIRERLSGIGDDQQPAAVPPPPAPLPAVAPPLLPQ